ncbi:hypothetical protein DHEL01_v206582 [Diaporthe helianthi]|uniref:Uncharacterized protein n=1 Tax=Diaporthe helianthi TaxID=158607 RepID=A0A2P5HXQ0_DIAHE|nr:hypothetical protein DHEL01_v206582 [Diaporthe helianthi]
MYGGQGSKIIEDLCLAVKGNPTIGDENDISTQSASPPPYREATVRPCAGPSTGPAAHSPRLEQHQPHKPSTKRRRPSSSPELGPVLTDIPDPLRFIQSICNKVWDERQAGLFAELSRMEEGDGDAVTTAGELIDEAFDDRMISLKVELEDFVRDEFRDVETSIWDQLEAGTWETSFLRRSEQH